MAKILLVEDDPLISGVYEKKFTNAGMEVTVATSGNQVLSLAEKNRYDLIMLDIVIPDKSGIEVLRELRKDPRYGKDIKIVMFSNLNNTEKQQEALKAGADGFIGKSEYSPSELVDMVNKMLQEFGERAKNNNPKAKKEVKDKKILFIEDEEVFLEMFGKKLEDDGFSVTYAKNGSWGVSEAEKQSFDLIITDMVMPSLGGEEIIGKLRQSEKTKHIPIIVLSASVDEEDVKKVKELGVAEFFLKTRILPSDLSHKVSELIVK